MQTETELLDRKATAKLFGVTVRTIHNWVDAGVIPQAFIQMKRKRYWRRSQFESIAFKHAEEVGRSGNAI